LIAADPTRLQIARMEVAGACAACHRLGGGSHADTDHGQIRSLIAGWEAAAARIRSILRASVILCRGLIASGISGAVLKRAQLSLPRFAGPWLEQWAPLEWGGHFCFRP
jgi:hypothetical protein